MFDFQEIIIIAVVVGVPSFLYARLLIDRRRETFLREYTFPHRLYGKVKETYPQLTAKEYHLATQALRQFFNAFRASQYRFVGMPSQVADEVWHNFIDSMVGDSGSGPDSGSSDGGSSCGGGCGGGGD